MITQQPDIAECGRRLVRRQRRLVLDDLVRLLFGGEDLLRLFNDIIKLVPKDVAEKHLVGQLTEKQAAEELELIIRRLESGDMDLEESLESYTRGVELLKSLRPRLSDAEQKVSVLLKDVDGNDVLADGEAANTDDKLSF